MSERVGKLITELRKERGLTQRKVAELIGMNYTYLSKMENGRLGTTPASETLIKLADALCVDPDWLLTQCGRPPQKMVRQIARNPEFFERLGKLPGKNLDAVLEQRAFRLVGQIPAGQPLEAVEDLDSFELTEFFSPDSHFLLRVQGESMIGDNIQDGDLAVVRQQTTCEDGDIVVAIVDGQDATLKRLYRRGKQIRLQPSNESMEPIFVESERIEIRGKLVGMIRTDV